MYFDQLLLAACKVHVVYSAQLLGAAHYIDFISNFDQLLLPARKVHVVYSAQLLGAAHYIHFISNRDTMCF